MTGACDTLGASCCNYAANSVYDLTSFFTLRAVVYAALGAKQQTPKCCLVICHKYIAVASTECARWDLDGRICMLVGNKSSSCLLRQQVCGQGPGTSSTSMVLPAVLLLVLWNTALAQFSSVSNKAWTIVQLLQPCCTMKLSQSFSCCLRCLWHPGGRLLARLAVAWRLTSSDSSAT